MSAFSTESIDMGHGFSVEFRFENGQMDAVWDPRVPGAQPGKQIINRYQSARNAFLRQVGEHLGVSIAVVDLGGFRQTGRDV